MPANNPLLLQRHRQAVFPALAAKPSTLSQKALGILDSSTYGVGCGTHITVGASDLGYRSNNPTQQGTWFLGALAGNRSARLRRKENVKWLLWFLAHITVGWLAGWLARKQNRVESDMIAAIRKGPCICVWLERCFRKMRSGNREHLSFE